jgi:soluble lytic murein transglycosylase-like protein
MRPFRFMCVVIIAAGIAAAPGVCRAGIYTYTDERGVTHFTNVPAHSAYRPVSPEAVPAVHNEARFDPLIATLCRQFGMDNALVKAVVRAESGFDPYAVSKKGAQGLMQLMPPTARELKVTNPFDPRQNLYGGIKHLRRLLDMFEGDVVLALAAYNAGHNAVLRTNGIPPYEETRTYVARVLEYTEHYRQVQ